MRFQLGVFWSTSTLNTLSMTKLAACLRVYDTQVVLCGSGLRPGLRTAQGAARGRAWVSPKNRLN